jgi:cytochrome b involved in lipid metabolism
MVQLTPSYIANHNTQSDCWMILYNKVYDFTSYVSTHPGGKRNINMDCGVDGTTDYETMAGRGTDHSNYARSLFPNYYLGDLNQEIDAVELQNRINMARIN